jgi:hypothetical protein
MSDTSKNGRQTIVDTVIAAPIDVVWRALRDPERIKTWFGWEAPTLAEEIKFIFFDSATEDIAKQTLRFGEWQGAADAIVLEARDDHTRLQVIRTGGPSIDWEGVYDDVVEGWVTFFEQLRLALEVHPGKTRRTIYLSGASKPGMGEPSTVLGLTEAIAKAPNEPYAALLSTGDFVAGVIWHKTHFQAGLTVTEWGDGLIVVSDMGMSSKRPHGGGSVLLTTYGLDDDEFGALQQRWTTWWSDHFEAPTN